MCGFVNPLDLSGCSLEEHDGTRKTETTSPWKTEGGSNLPGADPRAQSVI